jgi:hypothetical protein
LFSGSETCSVLVYFPSDFITWGAVFSSHLADLSVAFDSVHHFQLEVVFGLASVGPDLPGSPPLFCLLFLCLLCRFNFL